jgi:hypothetical protein
MFGLKSIDKPMEMNENKICPNLTETCCDVESIEKTYNNFKFYIRPLI